MVSVFIVQFNPEFEPLNIQLTKARNFQKWQQANYVDSHYIYAKKKEFLSGDTVNVSTDEEDATKCYPMARQHLSP